MSTVTFRRNGLALSMLLVRATFAVRFRGGPSVGGFTTNIGNDGAETGSPEFWYHLAVSVVLVLAGGVFAGCVATGISIPLEFDYAVTHEQ